MELKSQIIHPQALEALHNLYAIDGTKGIGQMADSLVTLLATATISCIEAKPAAIPLATADMQMVVDSYRHLAALSRVPQLYLSDPLAVKGNDPVVEREAVAVNHDDAATAQQSHVHAPGIL